MTGFTTLIDGLSFPECPRWYDGRLYFSDFYTHRVLAVAMDGTAETIATVPQQPAGLGFLPPDGNRMLIVSMRDRKVLRREADGILHLHADLYDLAPWHLNDMLVDPHGGAWVGNFGFDLHGGADACRTCLIRVDPDGSSARVAATDLGFPNGMALTPDGRTLIVAETTANRLTAFTVENGGSTLTERRVWAAFGEPCTSNQAAEVIASSAVLADGICLDAEGAVWVSDPIHGRLLRVAEGGEILTELRPEAGAPFACELGGEDGRTLFACCALGFSEGENMRIHRASIQMTRVAVPGEAGR